MPKTALLYLYILYHYLLRKCDSVLHICALVKVQTFAFSTGVTPFCSILQKIVKGILKICIIKKKHDRQSQFIVQSQFINCKNVKSSTKSCPK